MERPQPGHGVDREGGCGGGRGSGPKNSGLDLIIK